MNQPSPLPLTLAAVPAPRPVGKAAWRAFARRERRAFARRDRHAATLAEAVLALAQTCGATLVGLYAPMGAEASTRPLANALLAAGIGLAYPRLQVDGVTLDFVACAGPASLQNRPRSRLMEPVGSSIDPTELDLVVTPALAVNAALMRLGQGGGSYDRYLPQLREDAVTVAAVLQACCLPWGPVERRDRGVDWVCTEAGLFAAQAPGEGRA